ncbi:MAG: recombinase family protein [Clostridiales bacterium]|nr:recombinase family protein [Clostridiales bacterium]
MEKNLPRAGCYVRVSTENQIENYSIDEQTVRLQAYCAAKDWHVQKIYTDGGYSGGHTDRPALRQMLDDIRSRALDVIVVYKLDRLSRSQKDTLTLIEDEILRYGLEFVSVSENFDTGSPFGRAMIGILSVFAQLEKDQIAERFTMGRVARCKSGRFHGGAMIPTGYLYTEGELIVDEHKAAQVREVYKRFLSGQSTHAIARQMHERYGGWNSHSLVANILRNNVYIGKVKFKNQTCDGLHKPIVDRETFDKTQALLRDPTPRTSSLLTGLLTCQHCGARYAQNHGCYKCYSRAKSDPKYITDPNCKNKNWQIQLLDALILNELGLADTTRPLAEKRLLVRDKIKAIVLNDENVEIIRRT